MTCTYLFDIDGVLIDNEERIRQVIEKKKPRHLFYSNQLMDTDKPRTIGIKTLLDRLEKGKIIIYSGRPISVRKKTIEQLKNAGIPLNRIEKIILRSDLEMEVKEWKKRLIEELLFEEYRICEIHEDDEEILEYIVKKKPSIKPFYHMVDEVIPYKRGIQHALP